MKGTPIRILGAGLCWLVCMLASSCGGGGGEVGVAGSGSGSGSGAPPPPTGSNVAAAIVDGGPEGNSSNALFVSVTVCAPGSTTACQTIDHVEVDTGSYGLRILSSALTVPLATEMTSTGASLMECTNFVGGYSWGPVVSADLTVAGETAAALPVQVIGGSTFAVPSDCTALGMSENTVKDFQANGILGIGPFIQDCGANCADNAVGQAYYACTTSGACVATTVDVTAQVTNPVALFAADNNGEIIQLPSVAADGAATASGYVIFGVDTQSNNASNADGNETVLTVNGSDYLTVALNGTTYNQSFIDSGSNGIFFNDSDIPVCTQSALSTFYCPTATLSLSALLTGANGVTATADFDIANTETLLSTNTALTAFPELGGTFPGSTKSVDFGLPFYYGRRVATVMEGDTTKVGTGPYFAF